MATMKPASPPADMSGSPSPTPPAADMSGSPSRVPPAADTSVSLSGPAAPAPSVDAAAAEAPEGWHDWPIVIYTGDASPKEMAASSDSNAPEEGVDPAVGSPAPAGAGSELSRSQASTLAGDAGDSSGQAPPEEMTAGTASTAGAVDPPANGSSASSGSFEELRWDMHQGKQSAGPSLLVTGGVDPPANMITGGMVDGRLAEAELPAPHPKEFMFPDSGFEFTGPFANNGPGLLGRGLFSDFPPNNGLFTQTGSSATELAAPKSPFGELADAQQVGLVAGGSGTEWSLPSKILKVAELPSQDGCIWRTGGGAALPSEVCTPLVVVLGPLLLHHGVSWSLEENKLKYAHSLIRRGNQDVKHKLTAYLTHLSSMEGQIRQRYDPGECRATPTQLVEMMVLDGLFIIEVLLNHWMGKSDQGLLPLPPQVKKDLTTQKLRWEPNALRLDLIVVQNQIPFFVLEKLFCMTDIPELGEDQKKPSKLKQIILDYLIGDADDALASYQGPVYHILHLVHLHLAFSSALPSNVVPRPLWVNWVLDGLARKAMDLRALCKRTFSRSTNLPVGWKRWKVIPPLRELVRVGVKLKRAETSLFADVKFKSGVLEIPPFAWRRYHIRLLSNLVVLEMSGWWPPEKRLFCSYVRFMAELIMKEEDATLLFKKGIVQEINIDDIDKSLVNPFRTLADFSHGSKYDTRFDGLVRDMVKCYETWSKVGVVPRSGR